MAEGEGAIGTAFIHGAGLGAWIWKDVEPGVGGPTPALDFPDRDRGAVDKAKTLEDYARHLADRLAAWDAPRIPLVCHSGAHAHVGPPGGAGRTPGGLARRAASSAR